MDFSNVRERPTYKIYKLLWTGIDWLFPPICGGCQKPGVRWCSGCQSKTVVLEPPLCMKCGSVVRVPGICGACRKSPPHFSALSSWAEFSGPLRNALHRLKYQNDLALGETFSKFLIQRLLDLEWEVDLVVPVPLAAGRQAERGYNQASMLARPLALASGIEYQPGALLKVRETPSQVGLSIDQRKVNVQNAFSGRTALTAGKRILIVDDICTSGATVDACSEALIQSGAKEIFALTLARAPHVRS